MGEVYFYIRYSIFKKPQNIEYRTPNVEVFFPDTLKKNYDEERGRPEMSGRFSFLEGGAHLYIQHHRVFSGAVLRLAWFYLTAEFNRRVTQSLTAEFNRRV